MSGEPVFVGTRVPIQIFWDYLEGGSSLDEFLAQYPTVERAQCTGLVALACKKVMTEARAP